MVIATIGMVQADESLCKTKLMSDGSYVDYSGERANMATSISNVGYSLGLDQTLTSWSQGDMATELSGFDVFVLPDMENGQW